MQTLRLDASRLDDLIVALKGWGPVWSPIETEPGVFNLQRLEDVSEARPDVLRTVIPFKKLLLPPSFNMVSGGFAELGSTEAVSQENERGSQVFFGAHACDVHALKILDLLYLSDYVDPYYAANRAGLLVAGYVERGRRLRSRADSARRGFSGHGGDIERRRCRARFPGPLHARLSRRHSRIPGEAQRP